MKVFRLIPVILLALGLAACGGSAISSAELGSGEDSDIVIGELGGAGSNQIDVVFPKSVNVATITAETFFAVEVGTDASASPDVAADMAIGPAFDAMAMCEPSKAVKATRSCASDRKLCRHLGTYSGNPLNSILFCIVGASFDDGEPVTPLVRWVPLAPIPGYPKVLAVSPTDGKKDVLLDTNVEIVFSKELDKRSVTSSTVRLENDAGVVSATLAYDEETRKATLDPKAPLEAGSSYRVRVSSIRDEAGLAMLGTFRSSFTTAGAVAVPWPPCDADGKGALPSCATFFAAFEKPPCVPFEGSPKEAPNGGVGYSYDGVTVARLIEKEPEAWIACLVAGTQNAAARETIQDGCIPLDLIFATMRSQVCEPPSLAVSAERVSLSCVAGSSCTQASVDVRNAGGRTLTWTAACTEGSCGVLTMSPTSGSLAAGATRAVSIGASAAGLDAGDYRANVEISANGGMASVGVDISVSPGGGGEENQPPVAAGQSVDVNAGSSVGITLQGSDPDGDNLTYIITSAPAVGVLQFLTVTCVPMGPGVPCMPVPVTSSVPGDTSWYQLPGATLTYQAPAGGSRVESFTFVVQDPDAATSAPATVTINVNGGAVCGVQAPQVTDDTYEFTFGQSLSRPALTGLLANDSDLDGDQLEAILVTSPGMATFSVMSDGAFYYNPTGPGTFQYNYVARKACDTGIGSTGTVTFVVSEEAQQPPGDVAVKLASVTSAGAQGSGPSSYAVISASGRYVAFRSRAQNLEPNAVWCQDEWGMQSSSHIFVHDLVTGETAMANLRNGGSISDQCVYSTSGFPGISTDGQFVVFASADATLVENDFNGAADIFVHDRVTLATTRVSVSSVGAEANSFSGSPAITPDGRYVVFTSYASNLVENDFNSRSDVFVRDRVAGTTTLVSATPSGYSGDEESREASSERMPAISADGRYVAFSSLASNLVVGDSYGTWDVFLRDMALGTTIRIGPGYSPSISADGMYVAFESQEPLVPGDTNIFNDIYLYSVQTGAIAWMSVGIDGAAGDSTSYLASISADGRYVAFGSCAANIVANDLNNQCDILVRNTVLNTTRIVSVDGNGTQSNSYSQFPSISADGRYVAFQSGATNLVDVDTNAQLDVFVADAFWFTPD